MPDALLLNCVSTLCCTVTRTKRWSSQKVDKLMNWKSCWFFFLFFSGDEKTRSLQENKTRRSFEASVSRLMSLNRSNCSDHFQNSKYCFNIHVWRHKMSLRKYDIKQAKPDSIHYFSIFNFLSWKKLSLNALKCAPVVDSNRAKEREESTCISWSFTTNSSITFVIAFDSIIYTMIKN